jgi:hypothetical protein
MTEAHQLWNEWTLREREAFLRRYHFALGWSAHTWFQLPRSIQAKVEMEVC